MITLRAYQERVLAELWSWFERHPTGEPVVEACVGAGKSVLIAELCRRALVAWPETRILMLVHTKELIEQNLAKLLQIWPQAPVGVYSASLGSRQLGRAITYATIGSVARRAHLLGHVDLCLVDECHLISPSDQTMYRKLIDGLRRYCPGLRVVGWTGTAFRGDGIWLTEHGLFTHVAARVTLGELLRDSHLSPLVTAPTATRIDTSGVRMQGGDYVVSALAAASDQAELVRQTCAELVHLAAERKRWLIFAVTVDHAEHVADELRQAHGIACAVVSAGTPAAERAAHIAAFRAGRLRALVNVAVLTTGFDVPELDCIALLRATRSPVLYVQICGRGMRTAPDKSDCLWLDFTDTTATLGPVDAIKGRPRPAQKAEGGTAPFKLCPQCGSHNATASAACSSCGAVFPPPERITHDSRASSASPLSAGLAGPQWVSITRVHYRAWGGRDGKPPTLRVDYASGLRTVASEWVCLEHPPGYARSKAHAWWMQRAPAPVPATVAEAMARSASLREPGRLQLRQAGKYPEIVGITWSPTSGSLLDDPPTALESAA